MKALKWVGLALAAVLLLAGLAAGVLAWRFDADWAKRKLAQAVLESRQRTLKIDGDVALAFYPSLGVKLGRASLSERNAAQEFARIEGGHVSVRLLPLLSRQVIVDAIELDGLQAHIVRRRNGGFNFDDLATAAPQGDRPPTPGAGDNPVGLDIAGVRITRSAASFEDEATHRTLRLTDINLKMGRIAQAASGAMELAFKAASEQPKLEADVKLGGDYRYDLERKLYAMDKLALSIQGRMAQEAFEARLKIPQFASEGPRTAAAQADVEMRLAGPQRQVEATLALSDLQAAAGRWTVGKLAARWKLKQGPLDASGDIAGPLEADLGRQVVTLSKLAGRLQVTHPQLPMKQLQAPVDASLQADWGKSQARGRLSTRVDDSTIQAGFQVAKFSPFALGLDLAVDRLDIDRYFPASGPAKAGEGPAPAPAGAGAATPVDLSFLRGLDVRGTSRIGSLQARGMKLNDVAATLVVNGGRLDLNPLSARLYGGTLAGSLRLQADGNRVATRQALENVAIGPLIKDLARKDILEGRGRVLLELDTAGGSTLALRQGLNGSASVSLRDGAVAGINLVKSLRQAKAALRGEMRDAVLAADRGQKTDFSELAASFRIANGVARNDDLSAKSPFLRITGAGTIDLARERLDYLAKATLVSTPEGQEGKDLDALRGLTIPVRLEGSFDAPSYHLDLGALAQEAVKQQLHKRVEQQLEKQLGTKGLGDLLKGFGR
ncbi:AsmA family protein [Ramlibacter sp. AN1133]|uniref:AsmA family protein n=1 Tax=Ramlibacter sp. AN1133 TaxID=3133429 RepID=UPI0030BE2B2C